MSTINFLHKDEAQKKQASNIRAVVVPITTAVLVVYLVLLSALSGWWWWWSSKQKKASAEYISLLSEVNGMQQSELLVKQTIDRVGKIEGYFRSRPNVFEDSEFLLNQPFEIVKFGLAPEGHYFLDVQASGSAEVAWVADALKSRYKEITLKKMTWSGDNNKWTATYWYKGAKI